MKKIHIDKVSVFSCILILISINMPFFISFKTSRIAFGDHVSAKTCFGEYYFVLYILLIVLFVLGMLKGDNKKLNLLTGCFAALSLSLLPLCVSLRYDYLPFDTSGSARMTFGVGFLLMIMALYSVVIKCSQNLSKTQVFIINFLAWGLLFVFIVTGMVNNFSVMQEYIAAKTQFFDKLMQHIQLSLVVLVTAVILGTPLGYLCNRYKTLDRITILGISIIETIPTLALFAVMRIPLAYLADTFPALRAIGFGSFGFAPAFFALLFYALYLMVHNSRASFNMIDENYIENAYAMGMTKKEVFLKVQIPMAMPVLLAGVRITLVTTLVSASLASYVGGNSLGAYIVNGINALSIDMQLLGVIPIFVLTVCADHVTKFLFDFIMPGKRVKKNDRTERCL